MNRETAVMHRHIARLSQLLIVITVFACSKADETDAAAEPAGGAITLWTDSTELFMEHPALIVGSPDRFAVHLTDITDFAPLRSGRITLRFKPRDGSAPVIVTQDTPRAPGIYGPAPDFKRPGVYDLTLLVESPQARDSLTVRGLKVYAKADEAPREVEGGETGISFLKEQQWKTPGFRTTFATSGDLSASFDATGVIESAAGKQAEVTAPIAGLVDAASVARSPTPGQRVRRGDVLAYMTPSLGEGGSAYAEARAALREAQAEYSRAKRLVEADAAPRRRLNEAENRLQAAREALAGFAGGGLMSGGRIPIRAPISGEVVRRNIALGGRLEAGSPLFTIVDPSIVSLRVNVPAAQASLITPRSGAGFTVEGAERRYEAAAVLSVGSVIDPASRTLPVIYQIPNSDGSIKVGQNARVQIQTGQRVSGVLIPVSAVLDEDGRPIAYVQPEGETFEKRELRFGGRQGDRVLVLEGIKSGERVVTGAAYQVKLASLSTSVPAHGHEH
ncbi:MAG TPA: efflux RND transporter periplasmic adaptor subunit [Gemmatimonadaceae bacterium]|nr:efflux RND transporter periplasmic adaptor subunit [Gemmatimonadaceae bacterium]